MQKERYHSSKTQREFCAELICGGRASPFPPEDRIPFYHFDRRPFRRGSEKEEREREPSAPCGMELCDICRSGNCPRRKTRPEKTAPFLRIQGGGRLSGRISASGAKNSVLPIMAAAVLCESPIHLSRVPRISDTGVSLRILKSLGCSCAYSEDEAVIDPTGLIYSRIPDSLVREMRSSIIFLGSLAAKTGEASLCLPGGCELGARTVDYHLSGLRALGMEIGERGEKLYACHHGLHGAEIILPFPSVGATENILLAAVTAQGRTVLRGAAREPEIVDLCTFLRKCGADIVGDGSPTIYIDGVRTLTGCSFSVMPDRIETASYLSFAAAAGGRIEMTDCAPETLGSVLTVLERMGCTLSVGRKTIRLTRETPLLAPGTISTAPFPGFPTDAQPMISALCCLAEGESVIREEVFENRFSHLPQLQKMGAKVSMGGTAAHITGAPLTGNTLYAHDLRGGAALITAALAAAGESRIYGLSHIDRGYERLEEKLCSLGAEVKRIG